MAAASLLRILSTISRHNCCSAAACPLLRHYYVSQATATCICIDQLFYAGAAAPWLPCPSLQCSSDQYGGARRPAFSWGRTAEAGLQRPRLASQPMKPLGFFDSSSASLLALSASSSCRAAGNWGAPPSSKLQRRPPNTPARLLGYCGSHGYEQGARRRHAPRQRAPALQCSGCWRRCRSSQSPPPVEKDEVVRQSTDSTHRMKSPEMSLSRGCGSAQASAHLQGCATDKETVCGKDRTKSQGCVRKLLALTLQLTERSIRHVDEHRHAVTYRCPPAWRSRCSSLR